MLGYGGHEAAAGLTIAEEHLPAFREAINEVAQRQLTPDLLVPQLRVDAEACLRDLSPATVAALERLAPFGAGNPRPVLASHSLLLRARPRPSGRTGMHCWVQEPGGPTLEATGFDRAGRWRERLAAAIGPVSLAYSPVLRDGDGQTTVQLQIRDVRTQVD